MERNLTRSRPRLQPSRMLTILVWEEGLVLEQTFWKFTEAIFCTEKY